MMTLMEVTAKLRFARIAPQKARLVARTVHGLPAEAAEVRLRLLRQRAAPLIAKLLRSAVANAKENFQLDPKGLRVVRVLVNEGPRLKRWMPRARGSSNRIIKRTSHIEVVLSDGRGGPPAPPPAKRRKGEVETVPVTALSPEDLKKATQRDGRGKEQRPDAGRVVKPAETPRGIRRLTERKHGGE